MKITTWAGWGVGSLVGVLGLAAAVVTSELKPATASSSELAPATAADPYVQEIQVWQAQRAANLTKPDGWLTLIGLHFLQPGENTVGTAPDNAVMLANGPAHLGALTLAPNGLVKAAFNPGIDVRIEGEPALSANLRDDTRGKPTMVTVGTVSLYVIERDGKKALRVKDSEAKSRTHFIGLDYFPIDPTWRIEAEWVPFDKPKEVPIRNIMGTVAPAMILGKAVFTRDGHTYELLPIQEDPDAPLFFIISDQTSGDTTYAAARFLYADHPGDGKVILDFNKAQNPPCAFTPFATCPLPPKENQLPVAVTAGEKEKHSYGVSP